MSTKTQKFKQTEIGEIPKEWEVVSLQSVVEFVRNGTTATQIEKEGKKVTRIETISNGTVDFSKIGNVTPFDNLTDYRIKKGDILFSHINSIAHIGKVALFESDEELYHGMNLFLIRPNQAVIPKYLFYVLSSYRVKKYYEAICKKAVNQASLNRDEVSSLKLALPKPPEQSRIASVLSCIVSAILETDEVIEKARSLEEGLMQELLTRGIGYKKFKRTEIGELPKEWEIVRLNDLCKDFITGGTPSTAHAEYWNGTIPWTRSAAITKMFVRSGEKFISEEGIKNSAARIVPKNNVLIATRVSIGNVGINTIDVAISQDLTGMVVKEDLILPEYLYWVISHSQERIKSLVQGSTIQGLSQRDLKKFMIPKPPIAEQRRIASILTTIDAKIESEAQKRSQFETLKKGLMQNLLTGRVRFQEFVGVSA
jgi:type I restriction enzyme S subunit